jgi:hypothetical protein
MYDRLSSAILIAREKLETGTLSGAPKDLNR